jgi:hypothetical protein
MSSSKPQNLPKRHHFVPKFLLKQWTDVQGKLVLYRRVPTGKVTKDRVSAKSVGCEDKLYTFEELGEHAAVIETKLMSPLDDKAGKIVASLIESGGHELTEPEMIWWSHFLLSMIMRTPESVKSLKAVAVEMWDAPNAKIQADYDNLKGENDPATFEEWAAADSPEGGQLLGVKLLNSLTMNKNVAEYIRGMSWSVMMIDKGLPPLLTSDRAIFSSNGLKKYDGQLIMPLGPRHMFCAFHDKDYEKEVQNMPAKLLVDTARKLITVRAQAHVYANNMKETEFVSKWLGYEKIASMGEQLANGWKAEQTSITNPAPPQP